MILFGAIKYIPRWLRLGLGWLSTFMNCMFDTNNKKGKVSLTSF